MEYNELNAYAFVNLGESRKIILKTMYYSKRSLTAKKIYKKLKESYSLAHISNILKDLLKEGIIVSIGENNNYGRIYQITDVGITAMEKIISDQYHEFIINEIKDKKNYQIDSIPLVEKKYENIIFGINDDNIEVIHIESSNSLSTYMFNKIVSTVSSCMKEFGAERGKIFLLGYAKKDQIKIAKQKNIDVVDRRELRFEV